MAVSLRLIVDSGDRMPTEFLLGGQDAVVGRDPDADVLIVDATISGRHGILRAGAAGYTYTDTASRNGSALLHPPLAVRPLAAGEATPVGPDDVLLLGAADRPIRIKRRTSRIKHRALSIKYYQASSIKHLTSGKASPIQPVSYFLPHQSKFSCQKAVILCHGGFGAVDYIAY
jgi:predicted component of type VI protein secretion system